MTSALVWLLFPAVQPQMDDRPRAITWVVTGATVGTGASWKKWTLARKIRAFNSIVEQETDEASFFKGAVAAYFLTAGLVLASWLAWVTAGHPLDVPDDEYTLELQMEGAEGDGLE